MVAYLRSRSQRFPVALIAGLAIAFGVAVTVVVLPATALAQIADTLALGTLLPLAALRPLIAAGGALALGAIGWAIVVLTLGTHIVLHAWRSETPVLRPGDTHPDAPARPPIRASAELGPPLDLNTPAPREQPVAVDAHAARPQAARDPVATVAPRPRPERIETFELTPLVRDRAAPPPSLATLLDRLERSTAPQPRRPARSLQAALGALRDTTA